MICGIRILILRSWYDTHRMRSTPPLSKVSKHPADIKALNIESRTPSVLRDTRHARGTPRDAMRVGCSMFGGFGLNGTSTETQQVDKG